MNDITEKLMAIRNQIDNLIKEIEPKDFFNINEVKSPSIEEYLKKMNTILATSANPQVISFVAGVKDFAEKAGFISDKQAKSIDITFERLSG